MINLYLTSQNFIYFTHLSLKIARGYGVYTFII